MVFTKELGVPNIGFGGVVIGEVYFGAYRNMWAYARTARLLRKNLPCKERRQGLLKRHTQFKL